MSLSNSTARALLATTLGVALLAASGCSMFHRPDGSIRFLPHSHNADYAKSQENRPLEVPPDLDTPATDPSMQIPSAHGGAGNMSVPAASISSSNAGFMLSDTAAGSWERIGRALEHIDGATITQRSQLLNSYEVQYKGATMLLRANSDGAQSTRVDAVGTDGQPAQTPEAIELLNLLHNRLG